MNESMPYVEACHQMYGGEFGQGEGPGENIPAWLVFDQQYRDRYIFAGLQPGQRIPKKWLESGVIVKADTLEELAEKTGLPADGFKATVERFNGFARTGVDEDFKRGESAYDRYYGDPTNKPNPNLGEISHGPYYAAKMVPGDLGTKGGVRTDVHGRALRDDGSIIEGLYAAGNVSAPVMGHTYPGPGGTIGPAMTFGYLAALHLAAAGRATSDEEPDMPIDLDEAIGAELEPAEFSWTSSDVQLYHLGLGAGADPTRSARAALPDRRQPAGAADVRQRRADLPHDRAADGAVPRHRHRAEQGAARQRGRDRPRPDPPVGHRHRRHPVHRHLGQGQGRRDLVGDDGDDTRRHPAVDAEAVDLRPRRGRLRRRARPVHVGRATGPRTGLRAGHPGCRSRRCSTGCAATATHCTPIPNSPQPQAFRGRSCTACAPTAWLQGDGRRLPRRRRRPVGSYGARFAGVVFPGETLKVSIWKQDGKFVGVLTAPERGDAIVLSGVELSPA